MGFLDVGSALRGFGDRIDILPLADFLTLQTLIGSTGLNIVPLQTNIFTNCKSELKYFEAAIVENSDACDAELQLPSRDRGRRERLPRGCV